jgi:hypothetical protein
MKNEKLFRRKLAKIAENSGYNKCRLYDVLPLQI